MSADARPLLVAEGVRMRRGGREVLGGVGLELRRGETAVLLGPNGAGKSTFLAGLSGLEPLAGGSVRLDGRLAAAGQTAALARRRVRANIELALAWWGVPRAERRTRALEALGRLGVAELAERPAATVSGGEARRVHLARALAVRPDVLLLDEPFAGLDPRVRGELLDDVAGLLRDPGRATLVVVHDRAEAWALADRVFVLLDGALSGGGPPAAVLDSPSSPAAARFLGYSGEVEQGEELLLARPGQVRLDPGAPFRGRVVRRIPTEDGIRIEAEVPGGRLLALASLPGPELGAEVGLRVEGGVRFSLAP